MFSRIYERTIDHIGDKNPQVFREIKGRLKSKNVAIVAFASLVGQLLLFLYFESLLPGKTTSFSRYCTGGDTKSYYTTAKCIKDLSGNVIINHQLWWLDLFTTMSIIGIFVLLVVGSYMLMADITKEKGKNTLNFLRLTPQSALTILGGKVVGVPILVYLFGLLAVPLHLVSGLRANVSAPLILAFYLVLGVSCLFFYTASLMFSLAFSKLGSFQAWLGSLIIFFFSIVMMAITLDGHNLSSTSFDWLVLFYPGTFLAYLVESTYMAPNVIDYLDIYGLQSLNWYGHFLFDNAMFGLTFMLVNYSLCTFALWQGVKRRFHSPKDVVIAKKHSYWITGAYIFINLGFALQAYFGKSYDEAQFFVLFIFNFCYALLLIGALTPDRQTLQDWARFRHESSSRLSLWQDLLIGEKSPAILAIVVNMMIITLYITPATWLYIKNENNLFVSLLCLLSAMVVIIYATIYQLTLMLKTRKRNFFALATITALIFSPSLSLIILGTKSSLLPIIGLFSALPVISFNQVSLVNILGTLITQIVVITAGNYQLKRILNKAGVSETKALLTTSS